MHGSIFGSCLCANSFSPKLSCSVRVLSGTSDENYSGLRFLDASSGGSWIVTLNSYDMRESPCPPPSTWTMRCNTPAAFSGLEHVTRVNGTTLCKLGTLCNFFKKKLRYTLSYVSMQSIDKTVVIGLCP